MIKSILSILFISASGISFMQQAVPSVDVKTLEGKTVNIQDFVGDGVPTVISFWATWCSPCKRELNAYNDNFEDWTDELEVRIVAVSIDDQRSVSRVGPYINSVEWEFDVLLDTNQDLKRALNVNNVPHTFLVDGEGNIVWQHNHYTDGDEEELYHEIQKLQ